MNARAFESQRPSSAIGQYLAGFVVAASAAVFPTVAHAVPGATGTITVLQNGGFLNPTTVAVRDGVAFVPEGQLSKLPAVGNVFRVFTVALDGSGIIANNIRLPDADFYPEGISLNPVTNDQFLGSIFQGTIVRIPNGSTQPRLFSGRAPGVLQRGAVGTRVDNARNLLWVCDTNLGANIAGGTVVGLDLTSAQVVVTHELPANSFCNDIILDEDGSLFVAESLVGELFRIDTAQALTPNSAVSFLVSPELAPPAAGQFGANGLALVDGILFVSNTFQGTLVRVDPANPADVAIVTLTEGGNASALLSGPDGVLPISDTEVLVVENGFIGVNPNRLIKVTFDPE
jgi:hypothetical protein